MKSETFIALVLILAIYQMFFGAILYAMLSFYGVYLGAVFILAMVAVYFMIFPPNTQKQNDNHEEQNKADS